MADIPLVAKLVEAKRRQLVNHALYMEARKVADAEGLQHFAALAEVPGVRLVSLQQMHGLDQLQRLSGPGPLLTVEAVEAAVAVMNRYPDMGCTELYAALARRFDVPVEDLSTATGSVALIYQILQAFCDPGDEVVYAWRSFEAYPIAVTAAAATSVQVPVTASGEHDLDAMLAAITDRTKVVIACTPNNPTGPALTHSALVAFLEQVPSHVLVIVDEAYVEFVRMDDARRRQLPGVSPDRSHQLLASALAAQPPRRGGFVGGRS